MQMMDMIPMVAMLVDSTSSAVGWVVHLAISAFAGAAFAVLLGGRATRLAPAAAFGMTWQSLLGSPRLRPAAGRRLRLADPPRPAQLGNPG